MTINLVAFLNFFHILKQATEVSHVDSNEGRLTLPATLMHYKATVINNVFMV